MLKADFHIHTKEDPEDFFIKYSAKEMIDKGAELGFDVLAITNHGAVTYSKELFDYAMKRDVLLISGIEACIEGTDVIILNVSDDIRDVKTFEELRDFKKANPSIFVLAPHPFYPKPNCLRSLVFEHSDIFDGVEYCHCYPRYFNYFNNRARAAASKCRKPMIGTSDTHVLFQFNNTYSLINAEKNAESVIRALKEGMVELQTKPLSYFNCSRVLAMSVYYGLRKRVF